MSKTHGVSLSAGRRKFVAELTRNVERMITESGNPNGFDAAAWIRRWINDPNAALGLRCPLEFFDDPDGRARIIRLLAMMQSGAFA